LLSTAGGKLTTFRATAEKVVDAVVRLLPDERQAQAAPGSSTAFSLPWRCDPESTRAAVQALGATEAVAGGLVRRLAALALPAAASAGPMQLRPVAEGLDVCGTELVWHLRFGGCVHLEDLLLRRVRLGMWQPRLCLELAPELRPLLRRAAGWSVARWNAELARLEKAAASWLPPEGRR
jgi:glycerol-3-phosphate dehydrogenase